MQEAGFLILCLVGCTRAIWSAQSNALVFALAALAVVCLKKERWWGAAFILAAAVHIKLWPAALALLLMARFPFQLGPRFATACAVLVLPPFLTRPLPVVVQQYQNWYDLLTGPYRTLRQAGLRDAYTIAENFGTYIDDRVYTLLQLGMAGLALLWCLRLARIATSKEAYFTGVLTTWVCWQLLVGPGTERLTFLLAAPHRQLGVDREYAGTLLPWTGSDRLAVTRPPGNGCSGTRPAAGRCLVTGDFTAGNSPIDGVADGLF